MVIDKLLDSLGHIILKILLCGMLSVSLDAELLDTLLAGRTFCPLFLRALVTSDVYVL